jgi:hypothetical protein
MVEEAGEETAEEETAEEEATGVTAGVAVEEPPTVPDVPIMPPVPGAPAPNTEDESAGGAPTGVAGTVELEDTDPATGAGEPASEPGAPPTPAPGAMSCDKTIQVIHPMVPNLARRRDLGSPYTQLCATATPTKRTMFMIMPMSQQRTDGTAEGSLYGIEVGTRWRNATSSTTVVVLWVRRSGVVIYRREGAEPDEERVTNVIRFVETFAPAEATVELSGLTSSAALHRA